MPDRPFPFRARGAKLPGMRTQTGIATTDAPRNTWRLPLAMAIACMVVTAALTILYLAVPELDSSDGQLLWLTI
jgi:hypothetical protein